MEWIKEHKSRILKIIILVLIILDFIWSVGNERNFFYWDKMYNPNSVAFYWVMKLVYTGLICMAGVGAYKFLNNPGKYVPAIKEWFRYAWPVLIVYGILMILLWPGNWGAVGDEFQTFLSVKNLRVWPDQGGGIKCFHATMHNDLPMPRNYFFSPSDSFYFYCWKYYYKILPNIYMWQDRKISNHNIVY